MDNVLLVQKSQALDDRIGKTANQTQTESMIIVLFYELVQVDARKKTQGHSV